MDLPTIRSVFASLEALPVDPRALDENRSRLASYERLVGLSAAKVVTRPRRLGEQPKSPPDTVARLLIHEQVLAAMGRFMSRAHRPG